MTFNFSFFNSDCLPNCPNSPIAEKVETKEKLGISVVGNPDDFKFNIIYTRTKREKVKLLIGLKEEVTENYLTMIHGQDKNDALDCLKAFTRNDMGYLSNKIGQ